MRPRAVLAVCGVLWAAAVFAAQTPVPPTPTRWVTDTAGFMSAAARDQLNSRLRAYEEQTHHQLIVWIGDTSGGVPIEDWAVRTFAQWKVGRQGMDDGLAVFIMAKDRQLRIEVGYGLEGQVPDAIASRIINDTIVPRIRAGDPDGGVTAGMEAVAAAIGGPVLPGVAVNARRPGRGSRTATLGELIVYGIIGLIVLIILATHPSLAIYLLANMLIGGRGGGRDDWGGGGGGGWGGGGGRSGGGGASGSW